MLTMQTDTIILVISLVALAFAVVGWLVIERQQTLSLEHDALARRDGLVRRAGRSKVVSELSERETRADRQNGAPVSAAEATRLSQAWMALQARFVDNPRGVIAEADQLVRELLERRGYSVDEWDHPTVVTTYLAAQAIFARHARGEADTEVLRKTIVYYRTLFQELLGVGSGGVRDGGWRQPHARSHSHSDPVHI